MNWPWHEGGDVVVGDEPMLVWAYIPQEIVSQEIAAATGAGEIQYSAFQESEHWALNLKRRGLDIGKRAFVYSENI